MSLQNFTPPGELSSAIERHRQITKFLVDGDECLTTLFEVYDDTAENLAKKIEGDDAAIKRLDKAQENSLAIIRFLKSHIRLLRMASARARISLEMATGEQRAEPKDRYEEGKDEIHRGRIGDDFDKHADTLKAMLNLLECYGDAATLTEDDGVEFCEIKNETLLTIGMQGSEAVNEMERCFSAANVDD